MIISKTPYRISLFGGGTDFPDYYNSYGGCVIGGSINRYCYISIRKLPKFFEHKLRFVWSKIENVKHYSELEHPSMKKILDHLKIDEGLEIHYDGDLPGMSGVGSSSSFTVGVLKCLHALKKKKVSKAKLYETSKFIEHKLMKEHVGSQDQFWATYGGFRFVNFNKKKTKSTNLFKNRSIKKLQKNLILFYTGMKRISSDVEKDKIIKLNKKIEHYHELKKYAYRCKNILNQNNNIDEIGHLLNESWQIKKNLSNKVSNSKIEELYKIALKNGALGGKIIGSGGGGFLLIYANNNVQNKLRKIFYKLENTNFQFLNSGSEVIYKND